MTRLVLFGYHELACIALEECVRRGIEVPLVVTNPPHMLPAVRWYRDIGAVAAAHGVPVVAPRRLKGNAEVERALRDAAPDVALSINLMLIAPPAVLAIPRHGVFNFHGALLPKYRGRGPLIWAIINGERWTGCTLHRMDEGIDTGPVHSQSRFPIRAADTIVDVYLRAINAGASMLGPFLDDVEHGTLELREQDHSKATYFLWRYDEHARLDLSKGAKASFDLCRALAHPFPGAYLEHGGARVHVLRAARGRTRGRAGRVLAVGPDDVTVGCGDGSLIIKVVAVDGGWLNGRTWTDRAGLREGSRL